jgi:hypothetical protein
MAKKNAKGSQPVPIETSLLDWAEYWYPISWKGVLAGGVITAIGACATIAFLLLQWRTTNIREEQSELRTAALEAQTAQANAALGTAQADIAKANSEIAKAHEGIASANARAAEANLKAETERAERVKLELRLAPRSINPLVLASQLAGMAGLRVDLVAYETGAADVAALAGQIRESFGKAGCTAHLFTPFADGTVVKGILVRLSADASDDDKKAAARIIAALNFVGLSAGSWTPFPANEPPSGAYNGPTGQAADAKIRVLIGAKP